MNVYRQLAEGGGFNLPFLVHLSSPDNATNIYLINDNQDMTYVNFVFLWEIPDYLKQAFSNYDLLPHPMAVGTRYREAFSQIFGFKGQNLSNNFYRTIFHKREEGGNE